jgi:hypothetical protein
MDHISTSFKFFYIKFTCDALLSESPPSVDTLGQHAYLPPLNKHNSLALRSLFVCTDECFLTKILCPCGRITVVY